MCIICQYQWSVSHNVTNIGWFLFLFSIEAGCFGSMGVTNFWKLKNIHWTKPKFLPQSLDFGNWLFKKAPLFKISPPKKGGSISTSKHLLDFGAPVVPATKVQSHSSPNDWWTAYSVLLRALVLPKFAEKKSTIIIPTTRLLRLVVHILTASFYLQCKGSSSCPLCWMWGWVSPCMMRTTARWSSPGTVASKDWVKVFCAIHGAKWAPE